MRKVKAVIVEKNENFDGALIVNLNKTEVDNLNLLKKYLPEKEKQNLTEEDKESIEKYNNYIEKLKKNGSCLKVDFVLNKYK